MRNLPVEALNSFVNGFGIARQRDDEYIAEGCADAAAAPAEGSELRTI